MRSITIFLTAIFLLLPSPGFSKYPRSDTVKAAVGNIREKPSADARVIQRVYRGDTVTIHRLDGKWFYIKLPDDGMILKKGNVCLPRLTKRLKKKKVCSIWPMLILTTSLPFLQRWFVVKIAARSMVAKSI